MDVLMLARCFGSAAKARGLMESLAWPDGVRCPRCSGVNTSAMRKEHDYRCRKCGKQYSLLSDGELSQMKLPIEKLLMGLYLVVVDPEIKAVCLQRSLGVSKNTALRLRERIPLYLEQEAWPQLLPSLILGVS